MAAKTIVATGLYLTPNRTTAAPEGALATADNVNIDRPGLIEPRPGLSKNAASAVIDHWALYNGTAYQSSTTTFYGPTTLVHSRPTGGHHRTAEMNSVLYITTADGIYRHDGTIGLAAGVARGIDLTLTADATGTPTAVLTANEVAYRIVFGYRDAYGALILGAPSQRAIYSNSSGGTRNVIVKATLPSSITSSSPTCFYQVYRSAGSGLATTEPNDELQLVYEANVTSTDVSNKYVQFTDICPDALRQATIYTAPSQGGIVRANDQPPLALDVCAYKGTMFYARTTSKHRLFLTILSVDATNGVRVADTVTIAGQTYTAGGAENIATKTFLVTAGSTSQLIEDAAKSLIRCINGNSSNSTVYASYLSGYNDFPGKILVEERAIGGSSFAATASANGTAYNPPLPTSGVTVSSNNNQFLNGLYFSKYLQPDAVPATQYFLVGDGKKKILRTLPLRDSVMIFKEDGIFRLTGEDSDSFRVDLFDPTVLLIATESAVPLNNRVFCLTNKGVAAVSDSGAELISGPIDYQIRMALDEINSPSTVESSTCAASLESQHRYLLSMHMVDLSNGTTTPDSTTCGTWVYNYVTQAWTRWRVAASAMIGVNDSATDAFYIGLMGSAFYRVGNNNSQNRNNFYDDGLSANITSSTATTITVNSSAGISVGDVCPGTGSTVHKITGINGNILSFATAADVTSILALSGAVIGIRTGYTCTVRYVPVHGADQTIICQFSEVRMSLSNNDFQDATISCGTEVAGFSNTAITGAGLGNFGVNSGSYTGAYSGLTPRVQRIYVPLESARAARLDVKFSITEAMAYWGIDALVIDLNQESGRSTV